MDRVSWGVNDSELNRAAAQGFDAYLRAQLDAAPAPLPEAAQAQVAQLAISQQTGAALVMRMETLRKGADAIQDPDARKLALEAYQREMNGWARECDMRHVMRAVYSPSQVLEQMTWFWSNHFNVHLAKRHIRALLADYEDVLRTHALGRFRDLLGAVAHHPAMLEYLDNEQNAAGRINENYARELMELHTLGVDAGYTQADVQELARVLTGVGVNVTDATPRVRRDLQALYVRDGVFEFNPNRHDFGPKRLLGEPITARGLPELDEALDRLARHPATARFISRKLAVFWMSDDPPKDVVDAMAATFRASDGRIAEVLRTMFDAPAFWHARKFKDPMRYVVSTVRLVCDGRVLANPAQVVNWLQRLGEQPHGHLTPDGYPLVASAWDSSGQLATRFEIARNIGAQGRALLLRQRDVPLDGAPYPALASAAVNREWRVPGSRASTRAALAQAASPQDWNTFLLASPEFNER